MTMIAHAFLQHRRLAKAKREQQNERTTGRAPEDRSWPDIFGKDSAFAVFEIIGGILAYVVPQQFVFNVVAMLTQGELAEDPRDVVANYLLHTAQHLSVGTRHFAAAYLLSHGAVKLWLILGLLREKLWYYPTAMVTFGLFIAYQLYRFSFTHSVFLLLITVLDLVVIALTWHENMYLRRRLMHHR